MKSLVIKRSVIVKNRKTSVSVEDDFWKSLKKIAQSHQQSLQHLIEEIDRDRTFANLSSAIRLFVLGFYKGQFDQQDRISEQSAIRETGNPSPERKALEPPLKSRRRGSLASRGACASF
jgi:predicted DNA-binding ribbon-helix-helix protein